jgi:GNAT superfamily N-acetyltransferase
MELKTEIKKGSYAVRITVEEEDHEVGRAWLYILYNSLHEEPFGFLEDVFVDEGHRKKGYGNLLVHKAVDEAKVQKCYKLIFTTRHIKPEVQEWYKKLGFKDWGTEFRMDLK